jgi:hypothetical protein
MDEPEFYRDDVQAYYDMQVVQLKDPDDAVAAVKKKFKLSTLIVTPTGEVRSPDVIDDPKPPRPGQPVPPPPPAPGAAPGDDEEEPGSQIGSENAGKKPPAAEATDETDLSGNMPREVERKPIRDTVSALQSRRDRRMTRNEALDRAGRAHRFHRLTNMRTREIREHLRSDTLRTTLSTSRRSKVEGIRVGQDAAKWVMRLRETEVADWTPEMWEWCDRITAFIERTRRNGAAVLDEQGKPTRKLVTLRTWGHDPLHESVIEESEVEELRALDMGLAVRIIDATGTDGPVQLVERVETRGPDFKTLKKNRVTLDTDERAKCMESKAVWRKNNNGPTPAVWKSEIGGKTWYVTNTHRAYNVAPTLEGAIGRFHKFIKSTA